MYAHSRTFYEYGSFIEKGCLAKRLRSSYDPPGFPLYVKEGPYMCTLRDVMGGTPLSSIKKSEGIFVALDQAKPLVYEVFKGRIVINHLSNKSRIVGTYPALVPGSWEDDHKKQKLNIKRAYFFNLPCASTVKKVPHIFYKPADSSQVFYCSMGAFTPDK